MDFSFVTLVKSRNDESAVPHTQLVNSHLIKDIRRAVSSGSPAKFVEQNIQELISREIRGLSEIDNIIKRNAQCLLEEDRITPKGNHPLRAGEQARYMTHRDIHKAREEYERFKKKRKFSRKPTCFDKEAVSMSHVQAEVPPATPEENQCSYTYGTAGVYEAAAGVQHTQVEHDKICASALLSLEAGCSSHDGIPVPPVVPGESLEMKESFGFLDGVDNPGFTPYRVVRDGPESPLLILSERVGIVIQKKNKI